MKFESTDIFGDNERAIQQREEALKKGYHFENLYDQNEDEAGERFNLESGERIVNDSDEELENSEIMSVDEKGKLKQIKQEIKKDPATQWLLDNGFDEFGNKKPKKAA